METVHVFLLFAAVGILLSAWIVIMVGEVFRRVASARPVT
jgi:hypothetical protein